MTGNVPSSLLDRLTAAVLGMEKYPVATERGDKQLALLKRSFCALAPLEHYVLTGYYTQALTQQILARRLDAGTMSFALMGKPGVINTSADPFPVKEVFFKRK